MSGKVNASKIRAFVYALFTKNIAVRVAPESLTRAGEIPRAD
jgi:hypothetical protein